MKTTIITLTLAAITAFAQSPSTQNPTSHSVVYQARQRIEAGPRSGIGSGMLPIYLARQRIDLGPRSGIGSGAAVLYVGRQRMGNVSSQD